MSHRQRVWAGRAYAALVAELGGKCYDCGTTRDLSIHHIAGKKYTSSKLEWSHRVSTYRKEMKEGKLWVLCITCNSKRGNPNRPRRRGR